MPRFSFQMLIMLEKIGYHFKAFQAAPQMSSPTTNPDMAWRLVWAVLSCSLS